MSSKYSKYIEMIDAYIEEPHSINRDWVELLREARDLFEEVSKDDGKDTRQ